MISSKIHLRFGDIDLAGHVHNAAYLHYFESARIEFFVSELGRDWDWMENGLVLKKNAVEYKAPIFLEDDVRIEVRSTHIGEKSFTLSYTVKVGEVVKTHGESVCICFNHKTKASIQIPEGIKTALQKHLE